MYTYMFGNFAFIIITLVMYANPELSKIQLNTNNITYISSYIIIPCNLSSYWSSFANVWTFFEMSHKWRPKACYKLAQTNLGNAQNRAACKKIIKFDLQRTNAISFGKRSTKDVAPHLCGTPGVSMAIKYCHCMTRQINPRSEQPESEQGKGRQAGHAIEIKKTSRI